MSGMAHDIELTTEQVHALDGWTFTGAAGVQLAREPDGSVLAGQGDERALIERDGRVIELNLERALDGKGETGGRSAGPRAALPDATC